MSVWQQFRNRVEEIQDLNSVQGLLGWDLETHMPEKGAAVRAKQCATLAAISHERMTAPEMGELIAQVKQPEVFDSLSTIDKALVREVDKNYQRETKLPARLVHEMSETTSNAHLIWVEARKNNDFKHFAPILQRIVELNQEMAECLGYTGSPYNALLDLYEPDLTTDQVDGLFGQLRPFLVDLVQRIQNSSVTPNRDFLSRHYDPDVQWQFGLDILNAMGFDFEAGRQDRSAHPFTMGMGPGDVRLTTRIDANDPLSGLYSSIHEGGHGLYEQGISDELARTPLDGGASLGIHESQSRLWENVIGRSRNFWEHFFPKMKAMFPDALGDVTLDQFYAAINDVKPSYIRVESDEVTYNLHILLRYSIEKDIIEGRLAVTDIPERWNREFQALFGITPPSDSKGCLQDVHWSHGSFGYFPTYTLGNLYSMQFYQAAKAAIPSLEAGIRQGQLLPLKSWLNENIHKLSKVETPAEIVQRVTGSPLDAKPFMDYLSAKYTALYHL